MSQVRRQKRQAGLHIGALAIPRDEAMHGKGGAQIVRAGPVSRITVADVGLPQQAREGVLQAPERDRSSLPRREEDRAVPVGQRPSRPIGLVLRQRTAQVGADGHESRFEEFAIPDGEKTIAEVDVAIAQTKRFARAKSGGVEDQEEE